MTRCIDAVNQILQPPVLKQDTTKNVIEILCHASLPHVSTMHYIIACDKISHTFPLHFCILLSDQELYDGTGMEKRLLVSLCEQAMQN